MKHHASTCRWAVPTLFLPAPFWWEAEDRPWACVRSGTPRVLETTEACADCQHWEPLTPGRVTEPMTLVEALREALEDTYRARATCRKVVEVEIPEEPHRKQKLRGGEPSSDLEEETAVSLTVAERGG